MKTVSYQGEPGAYSEQAAIKFFGENISLSPSVTFEMVFQKVKNKVTNFGIVPVENSLYGSVFDTQDLLLKYSLNVIGELYLGINHFLMAKKKLNLKNIKKIYSHPQALGQCSNFLSSLKSVEIQPVYDTAGAAKLIANGESNDTAAIASQLAAQNYNLKIIRGNIQNNKNNFTRFLVLANKTFKIKKCTNCKTSLCFQLKSTPGSLFKALSVFAFRDIDLTKIGSRPIPGKAFQYIFYIDIIGDIEDENIQNAIKHLKEMSTDVKIFGSYEMGEMYP